MHEATNIVTDIWIFMSYNNLVIILRFKKLKKKIF